MPRKPDRDCCEVSAKINPRASRSKIEVSDGANLHIWTTAPPTDGQANAAVCELIAKAARLPKSSVAVVGGLSSRFKRLRIDGLTLEELIRRLGNSA